MNLKTSGLIKLALVLFITISVIPLAAEQLRVFHELNRFLDSQGNTIYHFNYKIPNNELVFAETADGYLAKVDVVISARDNEGNVSEVEQFTHYIGVRDKNTALSRTHYYLDRISLPLSRAGFDLIITFTEQLSQKSFQWVESLVNLDKGTLASDIEFSHQISSGQLREGLEKFQRGDVQFYVDPSHIYQKGVNDTVFFYYEVQNLYPAGDGYTYLDETIRIFNDEYSAKINNRLRGSGTTFDRIITIPSDTLATAYYNLEITVHDPVSHRSETRHDYFVISERAEHSVRLFSDLDTEYKLLRYFLPSSHFRNWDSMSTSAKMNFVDRFWSINNPNPHSDENEFLRIIRERISVANQRFTHFNDGWDTDRGRIYVRNGEPTEVESDTVDTGIDAKLLRREYQIWRYRDLNRIYLFLDMQGTGNYRLVYNSNDDMEHNMHNWERLMGEEFDHGKLQ